MTGFGEAGHTGEIFHRSAPVARRAREGSSSADGVDLRFADVFWENDGSDSFQLISDRHRLK